MRTEIVRADGTLQLGEHARLAGYRPGMAVRVLVASSGSLILSLDDTPPLDVRYRALPNAPKSPLGASGATQPHKPTLTTPDAVRDAERMPR